MSIGDQGWDGQVRIIACSQILASSKKNSDEDINEI